MKLNKPYSNKQYADFAVYCNKNGLIIEDKGDYLEAVNPPEPTLEQLSQEIRKKRDNLINSIFWRIERYQSQVALGIETADTEKVYKNLLQYVEDLRNVPNQEEFPTNVVWPEFLG